ncbi:hypothetical protein DCAR_0728850 [Daucus carota subsp. sativus]|uniref:Thioredoxin-like fold domain-containing protein n=1 Tax=Daucus carota subsp. sativus TaxID=79200 RepID=A0A161Y6S0_DAUCS|nr:PREDICTED: uncharacterized protein LOC108196367 [Daucus carota subsp. sativus]WOH09393.1 hypothetical protein DCAR_0728850 [Daucus carota subsp. sativus]
MATLKHSNAQIPIVNRTNIIIVVLLLLLAEIDEAQVTIPDKYDGFVYSLPKGPDFISIEAFLDPVCSDSRDSWLPLKQLVHHYPSSIFLIVHPFPLPYHDNAFITSRALHVVDKINSSATFGLLEKFFENQERFYNAQTFNWSRASVVDLVAKFAAKATGLSNKSAIQAGFEDSTTDQATRISFKYGCSRGVFGAPVFFVNGFVLPNQGTPVDYETWRSIIDPLLDKKGITRQDLVQFS